MQVSKPVTVKPPSPHSAQLPPTPPSSRRGSRKPSTGHGTPDVDRTSHHKSDERHDEEPRHYPLPPRYKTGNSVLPEDLKTPDSHVVRDPRLIRLTGVHPFNVEAPLSALYDEGFLTTKDLHYVRNHGAVPKVDDAEVMDWEFTIEGLVDNPIRLSLAQLIRDYEQVTYPVTLVCAGNRRKEQNVVRKTKGFSWGAAGLSTALWTGVAIGDLLKVAKPRRRARYVCFEGADKLPNGYYGTSVKLSWAMDPERGILVAHKMNGETLAPDHGKPLRIVVPGQIGGRSVKWLTRIIVTDTPSDNWYHIYDNRVLPTMIDPEMSASLPDTWKDERYAIYDLNTNSATCYPAHDETVALGTGGAEKYSLRGYAYAGGGKRVTRVEVTLDKGRTWMLANISYPEDEYRRAPESEELFGGRLDMSWRESSFCWCLWDLEIPLSDLATADDAMVRAMDEAMNVQPRDMYWSVLGMMNNPWYRVVIHKEGNRLRFEHPTQPALLPGGWMERAKKAGGNIANGFWGENLPEVEEEVVVEAESREICMVNEKCSGRKISIEALRRHDGEDEAWFVVNGQVYDGTKFLDEHPGGATSILGSAGQDASEEFLAIHSENAKAMLVDYHIGSLDEAAARAIAAGEEILSEAAAPTTPRETFLQPKTWTKALLSAKRQISPNTKIFTFDLEHADQVAGLPIGHHLMMRLRDPATREAVIRAYTPISRRAERGKLEVLVKIYRGSVDRKGGRLTMALDALPLGHFVDFRGPVGKFEYLGRGQCVLSGGRRRYVKRFVMVCAGSGITPIFQVLQAVMADPQDGTACLVIDQNATEEDILLRRELEDLASGNKHRLRLLCLLNRSLPAWRGLRGRVDTALFEKEVGFGSRVKNAGAVEAGAVEAGAVEAEAEHMALVCGPDGFTSGVRSILMDMGWGEQDMVIF